MWSRWSWSRRWRSSIAGVLLACLPGLSYGQISQDQVQSIAEMSLEDLIEFNVSDVASLFQQDELEVGSSIVVIERDRWGLFGSRTLQEALNHDAGFLAVPNVDGNFVLPIRGYLNSTSDRGVAVLLDGVPINEFSRGSGTRKYQLGVLRRIEMLKGPGSAVHGADAFHGVLSLKTVAPTREGIQFFVEGGSKSYAELGLEGRKDLAESVRLTVAGSVNGRGDQDAPYSYTDPETGTVESTTRRDEYKAGMAVVKLDVEPDGPLAFLGGFYFAGQDSREAPGVGTLFSEGVSASKDGDHTNYDSRFYMGKADLRFTADSGLETALETYYWTEDTDRLDENSPTVPGNPDVFGEVDLRRLGGRLIARHHSRSIRTKWAVGVGYESHEVARAQATIRGDKGDAPPFVINTDGKDRTVQSALLEATTSFGPASADPNRFHLIYGGRLDEYSDVGTQLSPRLGAIYQPTSKSAIKVLYGEAFRPPTAIELYGLLPGVRNDIEPETINTTELIGMIEGDRWTGSLNFFYSDWKNVIGIGPGGSATNLGNYDSKGVEAEGRVVLRHFAFDVSGSFVDSRNVSADYDYTAFPKWIFNLGVGYENPVRKIRAYVHNRIHLDATDGTPLPGFPMPSDLDPYLRVDLHGDWQPQEVVTVFANVRNLFDRKNFFPSPTNAEFGLQDQPLTASVGMRIRY